MSARPPIHTRAHAEAYPGRVAVIRDSETGEWLVWRGENLTTVRDTHAEAITAATELARNPKEG